MQLFSPTSPFNLKIMSDNYAKIDASPEAKGLDRDLRADCPKNAQEFEVLLDRYKKQSPDKYEEKLADGTFTKQAKHLGFQWPEKPEPVKEEKKEEPKEEKEEEGKPCCGAKRGHKQDCPEK